jgi:hypothetical protein
MLGHHESAFHPKRRGRGTFQKLAGISNLSSIAINVRQQLPSFLLACPWEREDVVQKYWHPSKGLRVMLKIQYDIDTLNNSTTEAVWKQGTTSTTG